MFDLNTRALGQASAAAANWFWNFIISRFTPTMFLKMGANGFGVYIFFASMMVASVVFIWFLLPETKGLPLEDMDRLFSIRPVRGAHARVLAEVRAREEEFRRGADGKGEELSVVKTKVGEHFEYVEEMSGSHSR